MVPHRHSWPTRYHGPNYTVPGVAKPTYVQRPYAKAPYMGLGTSPFDPVTTRAVDGLGGAAIGYFMAPSGAEKPVWVIVGALAGYAAGWVGLGGTVAASLWLRSQKGQS